MKILLPKELQDQAPSEAPLTWHPNHDKHKPKNFEATCSMVAMDVARQWSKTLVHHNTPFLSANTSNELEERIKQALIASPHLSRTFTAYKEQRAAEEAKITEASDALLEISARHAATAQHYTIPERPQHPHGSIEERVEDILTTELDIAKMRESEGIAAIRSQHAQDVLNINHKRPHLLQKLTSEAEVAKLSRRFEESINNELQGMSINLNDFFETNKEAKAFLEKFATDPTRHASHAIHAGGLSEFEKSEIRRTQR